MEWTEEFDDTYSGAKPELEEKETMQNIDRIDELDESLVRLELASHSGDERPLAGTWS
jgi:hypothetical protein